jgi:hypothetical protein
MWILPIVPGTELDAFDPRVLDQAASAVVFMSYSSSDTSLPESLDNVYFGMIEAEPADVTPATVRELVVPHYGEQSRAFTMVGGGFLLDYLLVHDDQTISILMTAATESSPSGMPTLTGFADQAFYPARPDHSTSGARVFLQQFVPALGDSYESLLGQLPQRAENPTEYHLVDEGVIIS